MKSIKGIYDPPAMHWVGDGFPVRSLFSYSSHGRDVSPFLLLDHAAPMQFSPTAQRRGVGEHPHRGFETVTIVYQGEVDHRDSTGAGGHIGPGDVQWMTAASGVVHEEFHSEAFGRRGGVMEMVQLWVNLPAKDKMTAPRYQSIVADRIPIVSLADGAGSLRVIAGRFAGQQGPAQTFTPIDVWDVQMPQGRAAELDYPANRTLLLIALGGALKINASHSVQSGQWAVFERSGTQLRLEADSDARFLLLGGEPIDEPVVGYGPFVMNTRAEIAQAVTDFNSGRFGRLTPSTV